MRARTIGAVVLVGAVLAVIASTASGATSAQSASSITVWLQTDAQAANWEPIVKAANAQFQKDHPGVDGQRPVPDLGQPPAEARRDPRRRERPGRDRDGQHRDDEVHGGRCLPGPVVRQGVVAELEHAGSKGSPPPAGSAASSTASPTTQARASSRTAPTCSARPGVKVPTSLAQFTAGAKKLGVANGAKGFSPVYIAGTDWYFAMSFVYDFGGSIATHVSGKWKGTLASPRSIAGLTAYKNFFTAASRASKTTDEAHPNPYDVYAQGQAGSMVGPGWFSCCVGDKQQEPRPRQFVMPSHTAGKPMPGFLGGSDLAVPDRRPEGAGGRLDQGLHEHAVDDGTARDRQHPEHDEPARLERRPRRRRRRAGSSRRRRTGSTWRTAISSATCSPRS